MKTKILALAFIAVIASVLVSRQIKNVPPSDFRDAPNSAALSDLESQYPDFKSATSVGAQVDLPPVPVPDPNDARVVAAMGRQSPGGDYSVFAAAGKIPVAMVDEMLRAACAEGSTDIKVVNPAKPMLSVEGNALKLSNYSLPLNLHPVIFTKPYLADKNIVALKISKADFGISGFLLDTVLKTLHLNGREGLLNEIGKTTVDSVNKAMADFSAANRPDGVPAGEKLLTLSYDNGTQTFYAVLSENFISALMPGYNLRGFFLTETDFLLSFGKRDTTGLILNRSHNIVIGEGDITAILRRYSTPDMDFSSVHNSVAGGIGFGRPGRSQMSVSGKVNTGLTVPVTGTPLYVAFTAVMTPSMIRADTVSVMIEQITINAVYSGKRRLPAIPGWVQDMNLLQAAMIQQAISALMNARELKPYVAMRRTGTAGLEIRLRSDVFLPALAGRIHLAELEMGDGVLYLKYAPNQK